MASHMQNKRSFTGHHDLLPAAEQHRVSGFTITFVSAHTFLSWTFGRGTVIWRIWPAVVMHTLFATVVTIISMKTNIYLGIPNVMLTVLGVVIGFVISYRAMSGYDRYWMGRTAWSDVMRNSRTFTRLAWFHVPLRLTPRTQEETDKYMRGETLPLRPKKEVQTVMKEKRMALDLIDGFVVALKHHLRSELGIYYEDLYDLVKPFHEHLHIHHNHHLSFDVNTTEDHPQFQSPTQQSQQPSTSKAKIDPKPSTSATSLLRETPHDPVIPPINSYGTIPSSKQLTPGPSRNSSSHHINFLHHKNSTMSISSESSDSSDSRERRPLLPAARSQERDVLGEVSGDLVPFIGVFRGVGRVVGKILHLGRKQPTESDVEAGMNGNGEGYEEIAADEEPAEEEEGGVQRKYSNEPTVVQSAAKRRAAGQVPPSRHTTSPKGGRFREGGVGRMSREGMTETVGRKHRPRVAGQGENLPLEALRFLSDWTAVLEERGTVPGTSLGAMIGCLAMFEDSLSTLERILTTPLPFVYSVHIRHTVWIYLVFLPFQLVDQFGWSSIPGTAIAAFIYLGFLAAGEEIEQPFGYDENDLDLDLFCKEIVHADIEKLKHTPCSNVFLGSNHPSWQGQATHIPATTHREGKQKEQGADEQDKREAGAQGVIDRVEKVERKEEQARVEGQEMHDHEFEVVIG